MIRFDLRYLIAVALLALLGTSRAEAHPHVFVDAHAEIVFDPQGRITAIRHIWQFDEAFTSYATLNLDADNDGLLTDAELQPLAKTNVDSLQEFGFFTYLTIGTHKATFVAPTEYFLQFHDQRLTLFYTLPLTEPAAVDGPAKLEVFDPEYFVALTFAAEDPAKLDGAPTGCTSTFQPPGELDAQTMTILGAIPMDQRTIPDELVQAASVLANVITIDCPTAAVAPAKPQPAAPLRPKASASPFGVGTTDGPGGWWLTGPLGPFFLWIGQRQAEFYKTLTATFSEIKADGRAAWLLLGLSFLYGIFHAAGPGHGKAVITSYLFATGASVRRGVAISFASAFVQALTAIAIVVIAAIVFRVAADTMTVATVWIEIASYALIVLVGLWLVWSKTYGGGHHHHHRHHVEAEPVRRRAGYDRWQAPDEDAHDDRDDYDDHDHDHHDHRRVTDAVRPSLRGVASAVLAVGIRPCSGAIIVLVFALAQGMLYVGIASTLVMAVGTGITVAVLATLAVGARGFAMRLAGGPGSTAAYRVVRVLEIVAAALVLFLGVVLLGGAIATGLPGM